MRWRWIGVVLMVGCSGGATGPGAPDVAGVWSVVTVNGQAVPAPTASGRTLYHGTLALLSTGGGLVTTCTGFPNAVEERVTTVLWNALPTGGHLQLAYPGGGALDTALVASGTMTWEATGEEALLGTSRWTLVRTSADPTTPAPICP